MVAKEILEKVAQADQERTLRAIQGLTSGTCQVTLTAQSEQEVSGTVMNGNSKAYSVTVGSDGFYACSCPDFAHRKAICKHMVALALYAIQNPQEKIQQKPLGRLGLKLARVRSETEKKGWRELSEELYGPAPRPMIRRLPPKPYEELP